MANKQWIGGAAAVRDTWTITVAGTWASGDIARVSIGNKDLLITMGASASTLVADIATEIKNAINAANNETPGTGFTWNYGGQEFLEFTEVAATVDGAVVTVKALAGNAGVPIGLTAGETTAGDGTATAANSVPATGPEFVDNPDNYASGSLPVDNDVLYANTGAVSMKYGLTYFRDNNIDLDIVITNDWTGQLGLDAVNASGGYHEYRQRYFQYRGGSKALTVEPGLQGNTSVGKLWIDLQDQAGVEVIVLANRGPSTSSPTIYLAGSHATTLTNTLAVSAGSVSVEPDGAPTDSSKYAAFSGVTMGTVGGSASEAVVSFGANARLYKSLSTHIYSGSHTTSAPTKLGADVSPTYLWGGSLTLRAAAGAYHTFEIFSGATLYPVLGATTAKIQVFGGSLDCSRAIEGCVPSEVVAYSGSTIIDPVLLCLTTAVELAGCRMSDITHNLPANRIWNFSAQATP